VGKRGNSSEFCVHYRLDRLVDFERFQYVGNAIAREKQIKGWLRVMKIAKIRAPSSPPYKTNNAGDLKKRSGYNISEAFLPAYNASDLLVPQAHNRIEPGCEIRGVVAEDHAYTDRHHEPNRHP
jgi:hypothetical protein